MQNMFYVDDVMQPNVSSSSVKGAKEFKCSKNIQVMRVCMENSFGLMA